MTDPDALITLHEAAALVPGADADTLKRRARQGKLTVYRPGKAYLTTLADVRSMIEQCRVAPKVHASGYVPRARTEPQPCGLSSTQLASAALDLALAQVTPKKKQR